MRDALGLLAVFLGTAALAMWWLFRSRQAALQRSFVNATFILLRLCVVFGVFIGVGHFLLGASLHFLLVASLVIVAVTTFYTVLGSSGSVLDIVALAGVLAPFYLTREFVLGFPVRKELILERPPAQTASSSLEHLHQQTAVVTSPLRPSGRVKIDGAEYDARSHSGSFVASGATVAVAGHSGATLIVNELGDEQSEQ